MSALNAILPIFLIMVLGKALNHVLGIDKSAWNAIERLVLYILFPALIINVLASAEFGANTMHLIGVLVIAQILMGLIGLAARFSRHNSGASTASIIQSNVRFNTFVGISIAAAFFGDQGLALFVVAAAGMIPVANLISITAFEILSEAPAQNRQRIRSVLQNPLIIACIIGGGLNALNTSPPAFVSQTLNLLSQAAIALGLLCAGAAIDFASLQDRRARLVFWSAIRLLGFPLIIVAIASILNVTGLARHVAIIAASTPTSTSGVILASQLKGDAVLAANLVAAQTLLCVLTIPLLLFLTA